MECFFDNYYAGFRNETISFDPCANGKCSFNKERNFIGCAVENTWKPCNLDECGMILQKRYNELSLPSCKLSKSRD